MNNVIQKIAKAVADGVKNKTRFPDILLGPHLQALGKGTPLVLFGAGIVGGELCAALQNSNVAVACFCDNDQSKWGLNLRSTPVISFDDLRRQHQQSVIVITAPKFSEQIEQQLQQSGFDPKKIVLMPPHLGLLTYIRDGSQMSVGGLRQTGTPEQLMDILYANQEKVSKTYHLLADKKSKDLYIARLTYLVSYDNLTLLEDFMQTYSESVLKFGKVPVAEIDENYFYFNNDVFQLADGEVLVDVGAFNGDTIEAFIRTCLQQSMDYKAIHAFEPDPANFKELVKNTKDLKNINYYQLGLWSQKDRLRFVPSTQTLVKSVCAIGDDGDIEISVARLDDILQNERPTIIKMDPSGGVHIMIEAIYGAADTIRKYRPKLAIGAYHSFEAIYEIPLLIHRLCPEYHLFLRHTSWYVNETDLYAVV